MWEKQGLNDFSIGTCVRQRGTWLYVVKWEQRTVAFVIVAQTQQQQQQHGNERNEN